MTRQSYKISRNICEITEHGPSRFFLFHFFEIGDTVAGNRFAKSGINADFTGSLARLAVQVLVQTTGLRRSGKSTLCHKVLLEHGIRYGYVNLDDDRLLGIKAEDLNTVLSCVYQLYGTDIPYLFLDAIQDVDGWHLFVNRLLRSKMKIFVTGSNAKLLSSELATHITSRYNEIRHFSASWPDFCQTPRKSNENKRRRPT